MSETTNRHWWSLFTNKGIDEEARERQERYEAMDRHHAQQVELATSHGFEFTPGDVSVRPFYCTFCGTYAPWIMFEKHAQVCPGRHRQDDAQMGRV